MLTQATMQALRALGLVGMAEAVLAQAQQPDTQALSFDERFGLLVDHEWTYRQNRRLARRLQEAKLPVAACVEDIEYYPARGLDRARLQHLAQCAWVREHRPCLICGATGTGKTFVASALGNAACREGFSTRYYRVPRLLSDLALAHADGSYPRLLARLARIDVLILDDWGLAALSAAEGREILEVLEDRTERRGTVVTSQVPVDGWHDLIPSPTVADAILDRLIHNAHKLQLKGESMRKVRAKRDK
jgi:DNA replication protein DnaC